MPSSSRPSPENPPELGEDSAPTSGEELEIMRQRFVEALRRAEIITLLTGAENERDLGRLLSEELCEVYDAEIGIVAEQTEEGQAWRPIGLVGTTEVTRDAALAAAELDHAAASPRAVKEQGTNLLGLGARSSLLVGVRTAGGRQIVIGAARLYAEDFDPPEIALLESVAVSTSQALERLWAHDERDELIGQLKASFVGTAEALANALEAKDNYTADHASEVADLAISVGRELGLGEASLENLRYAAIFHDIGKIAIPDAILNKPGPLDPDERALMMKHPEIGADMIAPIPFLDDSVRETVMHDHEHFDGSGYPHGLRGERIPLGARIVMVVDSFHAMVSDRPYRKAMPKQEAMAELARCSGTQFDPNVVAAFVKVTR